ncbi:MAG: hypothetical protein U1F87_12640 [Kiritimatiellia bacterium]
MTWRDLEPLVAEGESPGRQHVAEALVRKGLVRNRQDAFSRLLGSGKPAYAPKRLFDPVACIRLIQASGGVAVLAHPVSLKFSRRDLRIVAGELAEQGLDGIEVYYSESMPDAEKISMALAREFNLLSTGRSDFHGRPPGECRWARAPAVCTFRKACSPRCSGGSPADRGWIPEEPGGGG